MQVRVELVNEDATGPAMLQAVEQDAILAPWNLCSKLLHNFRVRPRLGERSHVFEISSGVTRELGKLPLNIARETIDHLCTPAFALLAGEDIASNFPIMQDKLGIGCERGLDLGRADALLDTLHEAVIELCTRLLHNWRRRRFPLSAHVACERIVWNLGAEALVEFRFGMRPRRIAETK